MKTRAQELAEKYLSNPPKPETLFGRMLANIRERVEANPKVKRMRTLRFIDARIAMWQGVCELDTATQIVKASALSRIDELKRIKAQLQ